MTCRLLNIIELKLQKKKNVFDSRNHIRLGFKKISRRKTLPGYTT